MTIDKARYLTSLELYSIKECYNIFNLEADSNGFITCFNFNKCFKHIIKNGHILTPLEKKSVKDFVNKIYHRFKTNRMVNVKRLISGLSCLCQGSPREKIERTFILLGYEDKKITINELNNYLTDVFNILYLTTLYRHIKTPPYELACLTVKYYIKKNTINLEEFYKCMNI